MIWWPERHEPRQTFVVFWINYTMSWTGVLVPYTRAQQQFGLDFLLVPTNFISFVVTIFGVLSIAVLGLKSTLPAIRKKSISLELNELKIGKVYKVVIDGREGDVLTARTEFDSPEVDNEVILPEQTGLEPGNFYKVRITSASEFDLYAEKV